MTGRLTCATCGEALMMCQCVIADCPQCGSLGEFGPLPCEAAWERQKEANASEPSMSVDEQHRRAWEERQALRGGRSL